MKLPWKKRGCSTTGNVNLQPTRYAKKLQDFVCKKYGRSYGGSSAQRCYERSFSDNYYLDYKRRAGSQKILKGKSIECKYCCSNCRDRNNRVEKGILVHQNNLVCLAKQSMYYELPAYWLAYWIMKGPRPLSEMCKGSNKMCQWNDKEMSRATGGMKWVEGKQEPNEIGRKWLQECPDIQ